MIGILKVIKYEGDNSTFVWKHPQEDFNTGSQLIVHETQEAVFFNNGQALDLFGPGRYTLSTQNIPILRHVLNIPTGGKTPFHCEVYFINKTQQMAIKWGTDSQVQYMEPKYNFPLQIGASGEMVLSVADSRRLLVKIVGTEHILSQQALVAKFRALLMSTVKSHLGDTMQNGEYSIFEIDSQIGRLSEEIQDQLMEYFAEYGLKLNHFYITTIAKPEGDPAYEKFRELHARQYSDVAEAQLQQRVEIIRQQTEAQKMIIESQALAQKRQQEGYSYAQEKGFDVAGKVAENEGVGEMSNLGIGLGMMAGVGGTIGGRVGGMVGQAFSGINDSQGENPNQEQPSAGIQAADDMALFKQKLEKLMMMKDSGLLTDDEFAQMKAQLLQSI